MRWPGVLQERDVANVHCSPRCAVFCEKLLWTACPQSEGTCFFCTRYCVGRWRVVRPWWIRRWTLWINAPREKSNRNITPVTVSTALFRTILMMLGLQSVEKVHFSTFAWALRRNCWKLVFFASELAGAFSNIYPELFPFFRGPVAGNQREIQQAQIRLQSSIASEKSFFRSDRGMQSYLKKRWRWFPATGPLRSGKQL